MGNLPDGRLMPVNYMTPRPESGHPVQPAPNAFDVARGMMDAYQTGADMRERFDYKEAAGELAAMFEAGEPVSQTMIASKLSRWPDAIPMFTEVARNVKKERMQGDAMALVRGESSALAGLGETLAGKSDEEVNKATTIARMKDKAAFKAKWVAEGGLPAIADIIIESSDIVHNADSQYAADQLSASRDDIRMLIGTLRQPMAIGGGEAGRNLFMKLVEPFVEDEQDTIELIDNALGGPGGWQKGAIEDLIFDAGAADDALTEMMLARGRGEVAIDTAEKTAQIQKEKEVEVAKETAQIRADAELDVFKKKLKLEAKYKRDVDWSKMNPRAKAAMVRQDANQLRQDKVVPLEGGGYRELEEAEAEGLIWLSYGEDNNMKVVEGIPGGAPTQAYYGSTPLPAKVINRPKGGEPQAAELGDPEGLAGRDRPIEDVAKHFR